MAHLWVVDGQDPALAGAAVKARHAVLVDVEVLADEVPQEGVSLLHRALFEQPIRLLDGAQGALGVLGHAGQHPLALLLLAPAAVGLLGRLCVVELESVGQAAGGVLIRVGDGVDQLPYA